MTDIDFEDPPERLSNKYDNRTNTDRNHIIAVLREHPLRWAIVSRHLSRNRASQVARVLRDRHQGQGYEFRPVERDGEGVVYGRWDPDNVKLD